MISSYTKLQYIEKLLNEIVVGIYCSAASATTYLHTFAYVQNTLNKYLICAVIKRKGYHSGERIASHWLFYFNMIAKKKA